MQLYIVAILVAALLITILFFALRSTVKRIDYNTKKYFVDKLQDYDYLIEEKKQILDKLNKEIEKNKKHLNELSSKMPKKANISNSKYYGNNAVPKYTDEELFEKYKNIKQSFSFDYEQIISKFINEHKSNDLDEYNLLTNVKNKINSKTIYKIMGMRLQQQSQYLLNLLTEDEQQVIISILNLKSFKLKKFIIELDNLIVKKDPYIYVYTGEKAKNYNHINDRVKTIYDCNINEGIRINYKGILYDYSL